MSENESQPRCCGEDRECYIPLTGLFDILSSKYAIHVICVVGAHSSLRFNEIENHLDGVSTSTLSKRLEETVDEGLVERRQYDEIPPRVEYQLTDEGEELRVKLKPLLEWVEMKQNRSSNPQSNK
ncbi:MAG: winged helix-turn-helix transcriptional regulator [Halobacteria archaeon]